MIFIPRPQWEDDNEVENCRLCEINFNFLRRKHHCRSCGKVICSSCSISRIILPQLGYFAPQRVCDKCVEKCLDDSTNQQLIMRWILMIESNLKKFQSKILKGIPSKIRPYLWSYFCNLPSLKSKNYDAYKTLVSFSNKDLEDMINHDVPRVFGEIKFFEEGSLGRLRLYNVLKAYGNFKMYSQHLVYLAAILVMHLDEENSFWALFQMMKHYQLEMIFISKYSFSQIFKSMLQSVLPRLYDHCEAQQVLIESFVMSWIETLFSQQFELSLVFRLWDIFFILGFSFILKFTFAILKSFENELLQLYNTDLLSYIHSLPLQVKNDDDLVEFAYSLDIPKLNLEELTLHADQM